MKIKQTKKLSKEKVLSIVIQGRREHEKGKTIVLASPEEIKTYFLKMMENHFL